MTSIFEGRGPSKHGLFGPKEGSFGFQVCICCIYIYIYLYLYEYLNKIYIYRNIYIYHISSSFSLVPIIFKFCPGLSVSNECSRRRVPTHHDQLIRKCPIATSILWWTTGALVCNYG